MKQRILYIGANSSDTNLNTEIKNEQEVIDSLMMDDTDNSKFSISSGFVGMVNEVSDLIQRKISTQIIHISGHATEKGEIVIIDKQDPTKGDDLKPDTLVRFLKNAGNVKCVLLNFCYSKKVADLIAEQALNVECVIGINGEIQSTAAVDFSKAFYKSLHGKLLNDQSVIFEAFSKGQAAASQKTEKDIYILFRSTFKKVSIRCLGHLPGSRFLNGNTVDRSVDLADSTEGVSGTIWEMNELSSIGNTTVVILKCLGHLPGSTFLNGNTVDRSVDLADSNNVVSGTRWEIILIP
jgi:hypothetical protein